MRPAQRGPDFVREKHIFSQKPRTKAVLQSIGASNILKKGDVFDTRLELQLRVSEVANLLGKQLRYSRSETDVRGERGFINSEKLVARCKDVNDTFLVRAGLVKEGWKVYVVRLSNFSSTRAIIYTAKQLVPLTLSHLSADADLSHKRIKAILADYMDSETFMPAFPTTFALTPEKSFVGTLLKMPNMFKILCKA
ncbi:MAG: hypothetical protein ACREOZ_04640 [Gloeomargaritales cyanobacterium]